MGRGVVVVAVGGGRASALGCDGWTDGDLQVGRRGVTGPAPDSAMAGHQGDMLSRIWPFSTGKFTPSQNPGAQTHHLHLLLPGMDPARGHF